MSMFDVIGNTHRLLRPFYGVIDWVKSTGSTRNGLRYQEFIFETIDQVNSGMVEGSETFCRVKAEEQAKKMELEYRRSGKKGEQSLPYVRDKEVKQ